MGRTFLLQAGLVAAVGISFSAHAGKVTWSTLLGTKSARMVWQKQSNGLPEQFNPVNTTLMYFDTKENTVRTLVGGTTSKTDPTFTWDGARVVYYLPNSSQIGVVNIDGTNNRIITGTYSGGGHCYQSGNSHFVLADQGNNFYRVNIDNPSDKTLIYSGTSGGDASGVSWGSISPDGTKIAGVFPEYPNVGIANVGGSSYTAFNPGGCWPTIARDGSNQVLYTIEPHTNIRIVASNGSTQVLNKQLTGIWNDGGASEYECLRWTNDSDILSCISFDEPANVCKGANPKIVRISNLDWASPNTGVSGVEGNTDVYVYSATETVDQNYARSTTAIGTRGSTTGRMFDIRGRTLRSVAAGLPQARIAVSAGARKLGVLVAQ